MDDDEGWNLFAVCMSPAGFAVGRPREIVGGVGDQQRPDVALVDTGGEADGEMIVVYDDNSRDVDEVWSLRVRSNGIPLGKPYALVKEPNVNASDPTTNGSAVAWVDDRAGQNDIWVQPLRNGKPLGKARFLVGDEFADHFALRYGSGARIPGTPMTPPPARTSAAPRYTTRTAAPVPTFGVLVPLPTRPGRTPPPTPTGSPWSCSATTVRALQPLRHPHRELPPDRSRVPGGAQPDTVIGIDRTFRSYW